MPCIAQDADDGKIAAFVRQKVHDLFSGDFSRWS
jgi:hypothetical protein